MSALSGRPPPPPNIILSGDQISMHHQHSVSGWAMCQRPALIQDRNHTSLFTFACGGWQRWCLRRHSWAVVGVTLWCAFSAGVGEPLARTPQTEVGDLSPTSDAREEDPSAQPLVVNPSEIDIRQLELVRSMIIRGAVGASKAMPALELGVVATSLHNQDFDTMLRAGLLGDTTTEFGEVAYFVPASLVQWIDQVEISDYGLDIYRNYDRSLKAITKLELFLIAMQRGSMSVDGSTPRITREFDSKAHTLKLGTMIDLACLLRLPSDRGIVCSDGFGWMRCVAQTQGAPLQCPGLLDTPLSFPTSGPKVGS